MQVEKKPNIDIKKLKKAKEIKKKQLENDEIIKKNED